MNIKAIGGRKGKRKKKSPHGDREAIVGSPLLGEKAGLDTKFRERGRDVELTVVF